MATKRKEKKKERPCGEGYRRVEIDPNEEDSSYGENPSKKKKSKNPGEKKFKCIKIRKPGIKKEELRGDKMKTTPKTDPLDKEKG